eukprot:758220-Hanusia_phi.AAC.2
MSEDGEHEGAAEGIVLQHHAVAGARVDAVEQQVCVVDELVPQVLLRADWLRLVKRVVPQGDVRGQDLELPRVVAEARYHEGRVVVAQDNSFDDLVMTMNKNSTEVDADSLVKMSLAFLLMLQKKLRVLRACSP